MGIADRYLVVPALVIDGLPHELDGGLRVVLVHQRHVAVVDEVDEPLGARGAVPGSCGGGSGCSDEGDPSLGIGLDSIDYGRV